MDESWLTCMGMSAANHNHPPRKSMETSIFSMNHVAMLMADHKHDVVDFSDVFGGPPRSVLCRKLSDDITWSTSFYEEVFRTPEFVSSRYIKDGRNLPGFKIPVSDEGFYSDIFGDGHRQSRKWSSSNSKAKSNSSSVLSSEELSPLRSVFRDDVGLSSFASKLRPINIPSRWNSTTIMADNEEAKQQQGMPSFPSNRCSLTRSSSYNHGFNRRATSPETISLEPHSFSVKLSADDSEFEFEFDSPSSSSSSLCHEPVRATSGSKHQQEDDDDDGEDEIMSSYVIEINSDFRENNCEAVSIDEAIAWAKESYNARSSEKSRSIETQERSSSYESFDLQIDGHGTKQSPNPMDDEENKSKAKEENDRSEEHIKMQILDDDDDDDDDVKLWSSGKENNIRLLLSTLHQILWPNSGWNMIPLTSLVESSQVKKAYQKARLCLHPDKLQQRGATLAQKHVADKAFTILQEAALVSLDVFFD